MKLYGFSWVFFFIQSRSAVKIKKRINMKKIIDSQNLQNLYLVSNSYSIVVYTYFIKSALTVWSMDFKPGAAFFISISSGPFSYILYTFVSFLDSSVKSYNCSRLRVNLSSSLYLKSPISSKNFLVLVELTTLAVLLLILEPLCLCSELSYYLGETYFPESF